MSIAIGISLIKGHLFVAGGPVQVTRTVKVHQISHIVRDGVTDASDINHLFVAGGPVQVARTLLDAPAVNGANKLVKISTTFVKFVATRRALPTDGRGEVGS